MDDSRFGGTMQGGIWVPGGGGAAPPEPEPEDEQPVEAAPAEAAPAEEVDWRDKYLRALAEYDNLRRRGQQQVELARRKATEEAVARILPLLDGFDRALAAVGEGGDVAALRQGVELLAGQFSGVLADLGVEPIICEAGAEFDPAYHEAVMRGEPTDEVPAHHVLSVLERGFTLSGKAIRAARVVVAAEPLDTQA
ncbi:MAG: nucleotide exchange factor GrpE [Armatimonadetes bacterium]|nr:nucleotide exchange factor GrpE [Armatimonadota bacterium]